MLGERNDLWSVNTDRDYHEEVIAKTEEQAPGLARALDAELGRVFLKLDRLALGLSLGTVTGLLLFFATVALVLKGGGVVGPTLGLLGQYFPGYTVTGAGSLLGLVYGFLAGFVGGWGFAVVRNAALILCMAIVRRRAQASLLRRILDFV